MPVVVISFLSVRPGGGSGHFLVHLDLSPVTKYQFTYVLKHCMAHLGLDNLKFSSHSFRIGAASDAATQGLPASAIMGLGRWKSDCFKCYVRPNLAFWFHRFFLDSGPFLHILGTKVCGSTWVFD